MKKEMLQARIRLTGCMKNYDLKRTMMGNIEEEVKDLQDAEVEKLFLYVSQDMLEDRFDELKKALDRMKEEDLSQTYRAAMKSMVDELHQIQEERIERLEKRAELETGETAIEVLGNLTVYYYTHHLTDKAKACFSKAIETVRSLDDQDQQDGWKILIDPMTDEAGTAAWLVEYKDDFLGETRRNFYVGMISASVYAGRIEEAFSWVMTGAEALKGQESMDYYFLFLWDSLNFLKATKHEKSLEKGLWEYILEAADALNHVSAVAKMRVFLANFAMGQADYKQARVHLNSLEGIVDAYGYELLFEEHADMIRRALADMRRDLPKASKSSPLRLVEITPEEMVKFAIKNTIRN
jgi:hypothetical protein